MTKIGKGKLTKEYMIEAILKKGWDKNAKYHGKLYGHPVYGMKKTITLTGVLLHVKRLLKLKTFDQQLIMITAAWNWRKDDLTLQPKYCIELVYYFFFCK